MQFLTSVTNLLEDSQTGQKSGRIFHVFSYEQKNIKVKTEAKVLLNFKRFRKKHKIGLPMRERTNATKMYISTDLI